MKRILSYVRPYAGWLFASVLLMALAGGAQGLIAYLIKPIFDQVLNPQGTDSVVSGVMPVPAVRRVAVESVSVVLPGWPGGAVTPVPVVSAGRGRSRARCSLRAPLISPRRICRSPASRRRMFCW